MNDHGNVNTSEQDPQAEEARVKKRALRILERRAHSTKELYDKLIEKGESPEHAAAAVAWLLEIRYLDDAQYANDIVRHYHAKGYGKRKVEQELWRRGITKELWAEAIEAEMPEINEDALDRFIQMKLRGEKPDQKAEKRVADALARRGHGWDEIRSALRRYAEQIEE